MVSKSKEERRNNAEYSLTRIHELASQGAVIYGSRRVQRQVEDYDYTPEDVHTCLTLLNEAHYRGSVRYENNHFWQDEYLITYRALNGHVDNLYIKLKLSGDCLLVVIDSYHPEGAI